MWLAPNRTNYGIFENLETQITAVSSGANAGILRTAGIVAIYEKIHITYVLILYESFNRVGPSSAYNLQWTWLSLIQFMAEALNYTHTDWQKHTIGHGVRARMY